MGYLMQYIYKLENGLRKKQTHRQTHPRPHTHTHTHGSFSPFVYNGTLWVNFDILCYFSIVNC